MLTKRIIPCLDVKDGKVVKGKNFINLQDAGDPVELAKRYNREGADELIFLDITASYEGRKTFLKTVREVAKQIFIPFTVGGGINDIEDIRILLNAGADKVSLNTAAIKDPELIKQAADKCGSQCIVIAIDAKKNNKNNNWQVFIEGGRKNTKLDAVEWAKKAEKLGAGEILLTSMDKDGTKDGYDIELTRSISRSVNIPIIASGGAGNLSCIAKAFTKGEANAALAASIFHYKKYTINEVKRYLKENNIEVRK